MLFQYDWVIIHCWLIYRFGPSVKRDLLSEREGCKIKLLSRQTIKPSVKLTNLVETPTLKLLLLLFFLKLAPICFFTWMFCSEPCASCLQRWPAANYPSCLPTVNNSFTFCEVLRRETSSFPSHTFSSNLGSLINYSSH